MTEAVRRQPSALLVVGRELIRSSRSLRTSLSRSAYAGILFLILVSVWLSHFGRGGNVESWQLAVLGRQLFGGATGFGIFFVSFVTPLLVSQGIIDEREGETLELLSITRLSPGRILVGKILSSVLVIESILLGTLPVLVLAVSLGGVGLGEVFHVAVQLQVLLLVLAVVSAAFATAARGSFLPAALTWVWEFFLLLALPVTVHEFQFGLGNAGLWSYSPLVSLDSYQTLALGPLVLVLVLCPIVFLVARSTFRLHTGGLQPADDLSLSADFWRFQWLRSRLLVGTVLPATVAMGGGVVLNHKSYQFAGTLSPGLLSWVWWALILGSLLVAVAATVCLLYIGHRLARRAARRARRKIGWREQAARFAQQDQDTEKHGGRFSRLGSGRQVWRNPVLWREVMARVRGGSLVWVVVGSGLLLLLVFLGVASSQNNPYQARESCAVGSGWALFIGWVLLIVFGTSSIADEIRRGTLPLLCTTPLSRFAVVRGKVAAVLVAVLPLLIVSVLCVVGAVVTELASGTFGVSQWDPDSSGPTGPTPAYLVNAALVLLWIPLVLLATVLSTVFVTTMAKTPTQAWRIGLAWGFLQPLLILLFLGTAELISGFEIVAFALFPFLDSQLDEINVIWFVSVAVWTGLSALLFWLCTRRLRVLAAR